MSTLYMSRCMSWAVTLSPAQVRVFHDEDLPVETHAVAAPWKPRPFARIGQVGDILHLRDTLAPRGSASWKRAAIRRWLQLPAALSADSATKAATRWPGVTPAALSHGHDLFVAKCNGCHGYPDLGAIPDERWPHIVEKMAKKSDLGPEDGDAVLHYVLASRSEQTGQ